jgi:hypothetical protein
MLSAAKDLGLRTFFTMDAVKRHLQVLVHFELQHEALRYAQYVLDAIHFSLPPLQFRHYIYNTLTVHSQHNLRAVVLAVLRQLSNPSHPDTFMTIHPSAVSKTKPTLIRDDICATLLGGLVRIRHIDLADKLWSAIVKALGVDPPTCVWAAIIESYGALKMPDKVLSTWDKLLKSTRAPDAVAYAAVVAALFAVEREGDAMAKFDEFDGMIKAGTLPSHGPDAAGPYNLVLEHLTTASRIEQADALFRRMQASAPDRGSLADTTSYNIMLRHLLRNPGNGGISSLVKQMTRHGLSYDFDTYASLLHTSAPIAGQDGVSAVFATMERDGIVKTTRTCHYLILNLVARDYDNAGAFKTIEEIITYMEASDERSLRPNQTTTRLLRVAIEERLPKDSTLYKHYREYCNGLARRYEVSASNFNGKFYTTAIQAAFNNRSGGGVEQAMRFYRSYMDYMPRRTGSRTVRVSIWCRVLEGLIKSKEWDLAAEVVVEIEARLRSHEREEPGIRGNRSLQNLIKIVREHVVQKIQSE